MSRMSLGKRIALSMTAEETQLRSAKALVKKLSNISRKHKKTLAEAQESMEKLQGGGPRPKHGFAGVYPLTVQYIYNSN